MKPLSLQIFDERDDLEARNQQARLESRRTANHHRRIAEAHRGEPAMPIRALFELRHRAEPRRG